MLDPILYGQCLTENVVNVSSRYGKIYIYTENAAGVHLNVVPYNPWVLASEPLDNKFEELEGNNYYKYIRVFNNEKSWREFRRDFKHHNIWSPTKLVDQFLLTNGTTYFKNTKRIDVSTLSFDIETTGLRHDDFAKVLIISNTYRKGDTIVRKMFTLDEYRTQGDMLTAWCIWVKSINPSILVGHNIFAFDIPYLYFCAERAGVPLELGRDGSALQLEMYESRFRVDQTRNIMYRMPKVFGRELVDTFFVAMKWDIGKKFSSYALKKIIAEAGLERKDRVMVNAGLIWKYWENRFNAPDEWEQVKKYAEHDGDDALAVYDMCADAYFYSSQLIPFTFERMCLSASGSQLNNMMLRYYLNKGYSIPKPTEKEKYQGAISFGHPGIYNNISKIDVSSLYPSIISSFQLYNAKKDPDKILIYMNKEFRAQRLKYKQLAKETGNDYYASMDAVYKALVNSIYGFTGSNSAHFNAPDVASAVTKHGREILTTAINWAESKGFVVANADTDSISFAISNTSKEFREQCRKEVNALMPPGIVFEDDGFFPKFVVIKAKNYLMLTEDGKIKVKGSALKSSKIEPAIKAYQKRCIEALLGVTDEHLDSAYINACKELAMLADMKLWAAKKTISEKTVSSTRANEQKLMAALGTTSYQLGDKVYVYFTQSGTLKLVDNYDPNNPDHDLPRLLKKLYNASKVFDTVTTVPRINYGLSTNFKRYNDLMRKKILPEKIKKPTVKNVLEEIITLLEQNETKVLDKYAEEKVRAVMENAKTLLAPKPKKEKTNDKSNRLSKNSPNEKL